MILTVLKWIGVGLATLIVGVVATGLVLKAIAPTIPPPGQLVDVGGHKLHIYCTGPRSDRPVVLLDAGAGGDSAGFYWLQTELSKQERVCSYDREGAGWSEPSGSPSDAVQVAHQLHALLERAEIPRPVVIAGHSIAGIYARVHNDLYPDDVAGIAFLDSSHPEQDTRLEQPHNNPPDSDGAGNNDDESATAKPAPPDFTAIRLAINLGLTRIHQPMFRPNIEERYPPEIIEQFEYLLGSTRFLDAAEREGEGIPASLAAGRETGSLGDMPILVVTAAYVPPDAPAFVVESRTVWHELQRELASLSSNARHVVFDDADHGTLVTDRPFSERLARDIAELVDRVASSQP